MVTLHVFAQGDDLILYDNGTLAQINVRLLVVLFSSASAANKSFMSVFLHTSFF